MRVMTKQNKKPSRRPRPPHRVSLQTCKLAKLRTDCTTAKLLDVQASKAWQSRAELTITYI